MLSYINKHHTSFSIAAYFEATHIGNQEHAENDFRKIIGQIIAGRVNVSPSVLKWAKKIKADKFKIFNETEAKEHWLHVEERKNMQSLARKQREYARKKTELELELGIESLDSQPSSSKNSVQQESRPRRSKRRLSQVSKDYTIPEESDDENDYPNKVQKYHWLSGEGEIQNSQETDQKTEDWIHDEVNLSQLLIKHRSNMVAKAEDEDLDNTTDML
ncbi:hypothetical protein BDA99DRAFT_521782 [Phascolomyces articulosus]|uniref:Uncharacterized protein n=1 Tax=Phascolomyces articulosus TaxID=60185 RepID=A0AAD5PBG3_9FUNG|nr:hypothetical protein BDA99DRAFT_521782 [Phascolomyces articulosus]